MPRPIVSPLAENDLVEIGLFMARDKMETNPYDSPRSSNPLPMRAKPSWLRIAFWVGYGLLTPAPVALAILSLGKTSAGAMIVQVFAALWVAAGAFAIARIPAAAVVAVLLVAIPWFALLVQTMRRLFHFITIGMEAADGTGSPALFALNAIIELMLFLPLTVVVLLGVMSLIKKRASKPSLEV